ncbi:hypothetical protein J3R30DRAFT_3428415, partial [Lentinula aciculospora]
MMLSRRNSVVILPSSEHNETMTFCRDTSSVTDLHIYRLTAQPCLEIFAAFVYFTVLILAVSCWRTYRKIVQCVNAGNAFILQYLQIREGREVKGGAPKNTQVCSPTTCGCTDCSISTFLSNKPSQCQCQHTCVACCDILIESSELLARVNCWRNTLLDYPTIFLLKTLKPSYFEGWAQNALWMIFVLHIPFILLLSIYRAFLLQGSSPGSYLGYVLNALVVLACFISITRFTRHRESCYCAMGLCADVGRDGCRLGKI